jgi:hypothetical protein
MSDPIWPPNLLAVRHIWANGVQKSPRRDHLEFVGSGVTVTDANGRTKVNVGGVAPTILDALRNTTEAFSTPNTTAPITDTDVEFATVAAGSTLRIVATVRASEATAGGEQQTFRVQTNSDDAGWVNVADALEAVQFAVSGRREVIPILTTIAVPGALTTLGVRLAVTTAEYGDTVTVHRAALRAEVYAP